ncbi:cytochrome b [Robiginitomaculum antarcticum]|uniref:cytochrome b n=1 Tax=Robiginitomaculum antarcticum TaxID=437507 RepID=UPI0003703E34|nr:cytochrome b [Robiginitomaculum antarcticum]
MSVTPTAPRYTRVAVILHWVIALLILGQLAGGLFFTNLSFATHAELRISLTQFHKAVGLTVLVLSIARLIWRLTHRPPALPVGMSRMEHMAAKATHILFYVLIIGIPLAGWLMVSAYKNPISYFGVFNWPKIPGFEGQNDFGEIMHEVHEYMAFAAIALIALHIGAALKHHFINKDNVLARMLPLVKARNKD